MRAVIGLLVLSIFVCSCSQRDGLPRLQPLARGFAEAWQPLPRDFNLDIRAERNGDDLIMHCILRNISAKVLEVDTSTLPWNNADWFSAIAVAADGRVVAQNKGPPPLLSCISAPPKAMAIPSGDSREAMFDLKVVPLTTLPRNEDLLLVWSYQELKHWDSDQKYVLSGMTLLNARSQKPPVEPKALPSSSVNATSSGRN